MSKFSGVSSTPKAVSTAIGIGRVVLGGTLFLVPVGSVRVLGVDSATAKRMAFVARMTAVRDIGLGLGTLTGRGSEASGPWLAVGAVADAVDAVVIAGALRQGNVRGVPAATIVAGAGLAAAVGAWAAAGVLRGR